MEPRSCRRARTGLTLVELVVVLAILAIVAGTALTATGGLVDETKYESTQTELRTLESALLGSFDAGWRGEDDSISFIADAGRLPLLASTEGPYALADLWRPPTDLDPYALVPAVGDEEVRLPVGWRGPYLRLGFGTPRLLDGWGRSFEFRGPAGQDLQLGEPITWIRSLGANDEVGGQGFDADAMLVLESTGLEPVPPRYLGVVPVRVNVEGALAGDLYLHVRVYGPDEGKIRAIARHSVKLTSSTVLWTSPPVVVGPRAVRAYASQQEVVPPDEVFDPSAVRSSVEYVTVVQGGARDVEIELALP